MKEQWLPFIPTAYAESVNSASAQGSGISMLVMIAIFFSFIYFAIWRPQMKRNKEQQALFSSLTVEDEVMTIGGLLGRISKLTETHAVLTIATNVEVIVLKSSVSAIVPKGTMHSIASQS